MVQRYEDIPVMTWRDWLRLALCGVGLGVVLYVFLMLVFFIGIASGG